MIFLVDTNDHKSKFKSVLSKIPYNKLNFNNFKELL